MRWWMIIVVGLLTGCDTPGPDFRGIAPVRLKVGQSSFDVRVDGIRAQAIRLNSEWAPRMAAVAPRMVLAIEAVSGCRVKKLRGDQAVGVARLDCGDHHAPDRPAFPEELDCDFYEIVDGFGELNCRPYP